ncbi:MAG: rhamnan synthesis F family protein [Lachnospiraceae bacterium]
MNRIGIFVFYDSHGIADPYIDHLLDSLSQYVNRLIIMVNGTMTDSSRHRLSAFSKEIIDRSNTGFDAGAYKEAILDYLWEEDWRNWDELLLFNDTFYGPVVPWSEVFEIMESSNADFWGLSSYPGGFDSTGNPLPEHVQAYFLVCRHKMLHSTLFKDFWEQLLCPRTRIEAILKFEIGFSVFFHQLGFVGASYLEVQNPDFIRKENQNYYLEMPWELLANYRFPVIKRKALGIEYFKEARKSICYLRDETDFPHQMIIEHLDRLDRQGEIGPFSPVRLEKFYHSHKRIYIYGNGTYGKGVAAYFHFKGWTFENVLVSKKQIDSEDVICFSDLKLSDGDGIILALGRQAFLQVYPTLQNEVNSDQLFLPGGCDLPEIRKEQTE